MRLNIVCRNKEAFGQEKCGFGQVLKSRYDHSKGVVRNPETLSCSDPHIGV